MKTEAQLNPRRREKEGGHSCPPNGGSENPPSVEWQSTTLGALASRGGCFIQTGPFGSQLHKHDYQETGVGTVNPTHLENNRVNRTNVPRVSRETADRLERHRLVAGDILFARRGEIGRLAS